MQSDQLVKRIINLPEGSFFLLGPRGVGKTTWLRHNLGDATRFDLLDSRTYLELAKDPSLIESKLGHLKPGNWVVIDEIQKIPALLDQVHRLIEEKRLNFALTGSSARKLRRSGANLLAGRALTRMMYPLTSAEWIGRFDLTKALQWGGLPRAVAPGDPVDFLEAYFSTYIKEEIKEEGLVRNVEPFLRFLEIAGNLNGQVLNVENVARESGVKRVTLDNWFSILEDTLVAFRLPAWRPGFKVREQTHPKLYWFDCGVARAAAGLLYQPVEKTWLGWALESWILHELRAWSECRRRGLRFYYYALPSDRDVDVIVELKKATVRSPAEIIGLEVKLSEKWKREWEGPLRDLAKEKKLKMRNMVGIYCGKERLTFDDFTVYPVNQFLESLHRGEII